MRPFGVIGLGIRLQPRHVVVILRQRIVPVGNAAGEGAKRSLMDTDAWVNGAKLAETTEFLELATMLQFQDEFVEQLGFGDEE